MSNESKTSTELRISLENLRLYKISRKIKLCTRFTTLLRYYVTTLLVFKIIRYIFTILRFFHHTLVLFDSYIFTFALNVFLTISRHFIYTSIFP